MKTRKSFPLRISPKLYEELEAWAAQELRSVNGQIEYLLTRAVELRCGRPLGPEAPEGEAPSEQTGGKPASPTGRGRREAGG